MINSLEGRPCHILTISSYQGIQAKTEKDFSDLFPDKGIRSKKFENKKFVFISSRVHPGEIPSSHVMNGFLKFITSDDRRAVILRDLFVFKIIPILNPDGVFRGYYRTDTKGVNLNRFYSSPVLSEHPSIYATRELFLYYHSLSEIFLYVDLHGHASKKGCFVYGNYLEFKDQIETYLFAKVMAMNCINFDFQGSNFTESNMRARDKRDGLSKEGSGRVALYKQTNILRCYTLECNYNTGRIINPITAAEDDITDINNLMYSNGPPNYTIPVYEDVGRGIAISILDLTGSNPISRIENIQNVRLDVSVFVASMIPFRFDPAIKKPSKSINELQNYLADKSKEEKKKPPRSDKKPLVNRNKSDEIKEDNVSKDFGNKPTDDQEFTDKEGKLYCVNKKETKSRDASLAAEVKTKIPEKKEKHLVLVQVKEMVFMDMGKETSSQRGRSMNKRISRKIILHSSSFNPKRIEIC